MSYATVAVSIALLKFTTIDAVTGTAVVPFRGFVERITGLGHDEKNVHGLGTGPGTRGRP